MPITAAIVQARIGSRRLPAKVLEKIEERTMLAHVIERLQQATKLDTIILAIPDEPRSAPLESEAASLGIRVVRGPEHDVLQRYLVAARAFDVDPIVRVTADCPLIDPFLLDQVLAFYLSRREDGIDLVSNTYPRRWPRGLDVEVVSRDALERIGSEEEDPALREHVTLAIYRRRGFRVEGYVGNRDDLDASAHRWTVDTLEDLEFVRAIHAGSPNRRAPLEWRKTLAWIEDNPHLKRINECIAQKEIP